MPCMKCWPALTGFAASLLVVPDEQAGNSCPQGIVARDMPDNAKPALNVGIFGDR